jgi:hypothetical protein
VWSRRLGRIEAVRLCERTALLRSAAPLARNLALHEPRMGLLDAPDWVKVAADSYANRLLGALSSLWFPRTRVAHGSMRQN